MKVLLFGGTGDGRLLSEFLEENKIESCVSVATDYGKDMLGDKRYVSIITGRLDAQGIKELCSNFDIVIDATHPYAHEVTENIRAAVKETGVRLLRLLRDSAAGAFSDSENAAVFGSVKEAAAYLKNTEGRIFVSTGSKELKEYCVIDDYRERLVARVLPIGESRDKCSDLGLKHVIYAKGPFSYEENLRQFKEFAVRYLVTKDGGKTGGFKEKLDAARELDIKVLLIKRPDEAEGFSLDEIKDRIIEIRDKDKGKA